MNAVWLLKETLLSPQMVSGPAPQHVELTLDGWSAIVLVLALALIIVGIFEYFSTCENVARIKELLEELVDEKEDSGK